MKIARRRGAAGGRRIVGAGLALALGAATLVVGAGTPAGAEEVEIVQDVTCQGANQQTTSLLSIYFSSTGGVMSLQTPMTIDAPEHVILGEAADVTIGSQMSIPPEMAALQAQLGVTTTLLDSNVNVQVAGGAEALWEGELPPLPPPGETLVVSNTEQVTATSLDPITFTLQSPFSLSIQISGGIFTTPVVLSLTCSFSQTLLATTLVLPEGSSVPGAPTGVTAVGGPGRARVSWTPPAGEATPPITGYQITAQPGGETLETSASVMSVDVIGLDPGDHTFTVKAINALGTSDPSAASAPVAVGATVDHFNDRGPGDPFYDEIQWLAATGITEGFPDGGFHPGATLTRQAMAAFLYRLSGSPDGADPTCGPVGPFTDVPQGHDFCGEIQWMKDEGITNGNEDGSFNASGSLTRQAMSAFLYRLANGSTPPAACTAKPFTDVPTSNVFCPQIDWMRAVRISEGYEGGTLYKPGLALTRQAMAAFLYRYTQVMPVDLGA